jgi:hypothetical protein
MRTACLYVSALALVALCVSPAAATDLGKGNDALAKTFDAWTKTGPRLGTSDAERRVMITGFGLFSGVDYNISGVVVESMANKAFWADKVALAELAKAKPPAKATVGSGRLTEKDGGAKAWRRTLEIDGKTYEVGFLLLDVLWDLGAAIALYEAETFQPHLIVMTGRGGRRAIFETGALNQAAAYPGFRPDGAVDRDNTPVTPNVFDPSLEGVEQAIAMTWDNARLADAARPVVASMGKDYEVLAATEARAPNTYICNNISTVVLHGLKRHEVVLAGGKIRLEKIALDDTAAGFFHYPDAATNEPSEVRTWARMLATVVETHFAKGNAEESTEETNSR